MKYSIAPLRFGHLAPVATAFMFTLMAPLASAQAVMPPPVQGVLVLTATATLEAPKDWMSVAFSVTREGSDAGLVQTQLKQAVDAALTEARKAAKPGQVELRSGEFSVYPRYGQKGQITGWQGATEVVIEGRDMSGIAQLSGKISTLTIARVSYSLSRELREKLEAEASTQAITRFRAQAASHAKLFGYAGYTVREVSVGTDSVMPPMEPRMRVASMAKMADAEALPVEAGKGSVSASVSGSVQMQ